MTANPIAIHDPADAQRAAVPFLRWIASSRYTKRQNDAGIADLMFGNPQDLPMPAYVRALSDSLVPQRKDWFAYKLNEPEATRTVAATLSERTGLAWQTDDVFMTNGGFAAIAVALRAVVRPGDEVIFVSPPWFFYELLILSAGGQPVRVRLQAPAFDLDVDAIAAAITPRTRAVLVNSPHNPSGRVYSEAELARLASVLKEQSLRQGRPIYLLSDEAYARIVFDGRRAPSPAAVYPYTFVLYSYGKQLLAPGQRIGYAAVPPIMPDRPALREAMMMAQCATGFAFPNALLQHALPQIEPLCIDLSALTRRRDRLVPALRDLGYETTFPEGTFYVLGRAQDGDDAALVDRLADHDTFVLPGSIVELPGWIRLSLTANDAMIEQALRAFQKLSKTS